MKFDLAKSFYKVAEGMYQRMYMRGNVYGSMHNMCNE